MAILHLKLKLFFVDQKSSSTASESASTEGSLSLSPGLVGKTALVTGSSRGIGATVARQLARLGVNVAINFRSKGARAEAIASEIAALGGKALFVQGDITISEDVTNTFRQIAAAWGRLDYLILNASGGLEQDKAADYAMQLNLTARVNLVNGALPLMKPGSRIVFVTSHLAHFHGTSPGCNDYAVVAASKRAGEDALRSMIPRLNLDGVRLVVVSGDLIEGTITPKLLERQNRGLLRKRRQAVGTLPSLEEFATAIVDAAVNEAYSSGETLYIGSTEWS